MEKIFDYYNNVDNMRQIIRELKHTETDKQETICAFVHDVRIINLLIDKLDTQHLIEMSVKMGNFNILHELHKNPKYYDIILKTLAILNVNNIKFNIIKDSLLQNDLDKYIIN